LLARRLDARLELALVHQALLIGVDQPRDAAADLGHLRLQSLVSLRLCVGIVAVKPPLQFALHAGRIGQELAHVAPHCLVKQVLARRLAAAHRLAAAAVRLAARRATVVGVFDLAAGAGSGAGPVAGVPALGADQQSLQQVDRSAATLAEAFAVLGQLLGGLFEQGRLDDRGHGDRDPLLSGRVIDTLAAAGDPAVAAAAAHRAQARAQRPAAGLAIGRRALVRRVGQHLLDG